jgi:hypothetical protein
MVLVGLAGLFLGSLSKVIRVDPGFETRHALTMSVDLTLQGYSRDAQTSFIRSALESVTAVPGVERGVHDCPSARRPLLRHRRQPGRRVARRDRDRGGIAAVSPGYFDVMQCRSSRARLSRAMTDRPPRSRS